MNQNKSITVKMLGGKCGCVFCRHGHIGPSSRAGWAGMQNRRGKSFVGKYKKGK